MIRYYVIPEKKTVIGVLNHTENDVLNKIDKILDGSCTCVYNEKYVMPSCFKAIVKCSDMDEFSAEEGMKIAKERIMNRYYRSYDKRFNMFLDDIDKINKRIETFKK